MDKTVNWVVNRCKEASTWRGLIWLLTACGMSISPEMAGYIATAGMALAGLVGVLSSDQPTRVEIKLPPIELIGKSDVGCADAVRRVAPERVQQPVVSSDAASGAVRSDSSNGYNG